MQRATRFVATISHFNSGLATKIIDAWPEMKIKYILIGQLENCNKLYIKFAGTVQNKSVRLRFQKLGIELDLVHAMIMNKSDYDMKEEIYGQKIWLEYGIPTARKFQRKNKKATKDEDVFKHWYVKPKLEACEPEYSDQSVHGLSPYQCFMIKQLILQNDYIMERSTGQEQFWCPDLILHSDDEDTGTVVKKIKSESR